MSRRRLLLRFLLLGALCWGGARLWDLFGPQAPRTLRIELPAELPEAEHQAWIQERLLADAARAAGLHRKDPVVRRRLLRNMRFLGFEAAEPQLLRRAEALGMLEADPVVRRRLSRRMQRLLESDGRPAPVSDATLAAFMRARPEHFERPPRLRITHRFFSTQDRGPNAEADARAALQTMAPGDPFLAGLALPLLEASEIDARLGPGFCAALAVAPQAQWVGPVRGSYGWHLVRIDAREAGTLPALDSVRPQVEEAWRAEQTEAHFLRNFARLRAGYELVVAGDAVSPRARSSLPR